MNRKQANTHDKQNKESANGAAAPARGGMRVRAAGGLEYQSGGVSVQYDDHGQNAGGRQRDQCGE
jgi:hypothetical protein